VLEAVFCVICSVQNIKRISKRGTVYGTTTCKLVCEIITY